MDYLVCSWCGNLFSSEDSRMDEGSFPGFAVRWHQSVGQVITFNRSLTKREWEISSYSYEKISRWDRHRQDAELDSPVMGIATLVQDSWPSSTEPHPEETQSLYKVFCTCYNRKFFRNCTKGGRPYKVCLLMLHIPVPADIAQSSNLILN